MVLIVVTCAQTTPSTGAVLPLAALRIVDSPPASLIDGFDVLAHHSTGTGPTTSRLTLATAPSSVAPVAVASSVAQTAAFISSPTASNLRVISLIKRTFPKNAWHDAEAVAWCESKFRANDIGFDSNGTHDRGLFQLNDGGTEQYLLGRLGLNPNNLALAFNPVTNVRAAALLFARDGWSQWSCSYVLA